jgi:hypothetical protein
MSSQPSALNLLLENCDEMYDSMTKFNSVFNQIYYLTTCRAINAKCEDQLDNTLWLMSIARTEMAQKRCELSREQFRAWLEEMLGYM